MTCTTSIEVVGNILQLHTGRAIVWPERSTLLIADLHLGKEHTFARQGVPIPAGPSQQSLDRLTTLIASTRPERLIVLGDLMHAIPHRHESWLGALSRFLDQHQGLDVQVCAGNHDRTDGQNRVDARVQWHSEPIVEGPFVLQHHPGSDERGYVLSGPVHPVMRIARRRGKPLRAPAFWFRQRHAVLPAFGSFTGGHAITPSSGDRVWVSGPSRVIRVPAPARDSA